MRGRWADNARRVPGAGARALLGLLSSSALALSSGCSLLILVFPRGDDPGQELCGDNVVSGGEQCDGPNLNDRDCSTEGLGAGVLSCAADCAFDTSGCDDGEVCDDGVDNDADGLTDCDDPGCRQLQICAECGDGLVSTGEKCDGAELLGQSCESLGFDGGQLGCDPARCVFDFRGCFRVEATELSCEDLADNDGNGDADCADAACAGTFACGCQATTARSISGLDNVVLAGDTSPGSDEAEGICAGANAREVVFLLVNDLNTAAAVLATLQPQDGDLALYARPFCDPPDHTRDPAFLCSDAAQGAGEESISITLAPGERIFLLVDGAQPGQAGAFSLSFSVIGG